MAKSRTRRLHLRPANESDAPLLFDWRNDPLTRANSKNSDLVMFADHCRWFEASLRNRGRRLLVAIVGAKPAGTVRLDEGDSATRVSWTVAPDFRGLGVGKQMVGLALADVHGPVVAEIKPTNAPSIAIAVACGLVQAGQVDGLLVFRRP